MALPLIDELQGVDFRSIATWSARITLLMSGVGCGLIILLVYFFMLQNTLHQLVFAKNEEELLKTRFIQHKTAAVNLPSYQQQMRLAEKNVQQLHQQLLVAGELPELLVTITELAKNRGLQFEQFRSGRVENKGFYRYETIAIKASGNYPEIRHFIDDITKVQRMVSIQNFSLSRTSALANRMLIKADMLVYYYLGENGHAEKTDH